MKTIANRFAGILRAVVARDQNATARSRRLVTLLAIAAPILLSGLLWLPGSAMASHVNTTKTFYLRNSGPSAFNLTLSETAGTATTESLETSTTLRTVKDTTLTVAAGTTTFLPIGTWNVTGPLPNQAVADLGSASLWFGLTTTDDNGLKAVAKVEVLKNTTVISTVDSACLTLIRTPLSAASIDLPAPVSPVHFDAGDTLSLRLSARRCNTGAPASGKLRLHYNRSDRNSNFGATIDPDADLSITKTDSPDPVTAGNNLTYTVTVSNSGPNNATGVTVSDPLPAGVTLVSATPSQGSCTGTTTVSCPLGTINSGNNATVTIVVNVNPGTRGSLSNTATATATQPDPTTPNTATALTTVQASADLSITKGDAPDPVLAGSSLTYTVQVTNGGPSTATAVTVTDTLPASVTFVSATPSQGSCTGTTTVSCNLGTLNVASSATVTIVATVSPSATGTISNTATATAAEPDPTTPNTATATTTVTASGADLSVTKTDDPDPVLQAQELTYTVTVTNNGPAQATGVTLTDTLPAGVTFVSVTPGSPTCTEAAGTVTCNLGSINNGSSSVVTIKVKPGAEAAEAETITNTATVSSSSTDPTPANNTATADTAVTKDTDEDGIPDSLDCNENLKDNVIVDPLNVVPASFTGIRVDTLQAAVIAASDNDVISMYANTTENVVVGDSTGSGGKDLLIIGCGHRVTASSGALPVIHVEVSAGANDGDTGQGERDIEFVDVDVRNGSGGYLIETSKVAGEGTDTLLKGVRAESSSGVGVEVAGSGNEVRGSNGVAFNASFGIQVTGNNNLITENRVEDNVGAGLDVTGNDSLIEKNKVGDEGHGNGAGIHVTGNSDNLIENDVFDNSGDGINVSGAGNLIQKNDVGDKDKGNTGDGIHVAGAGNTLDENNVFANGGDGIDVSGGTIASPNVVKKNDVGDRNKGNLGNGILVGGLGNGALAPVEIDENTVKSNRLAGIKVTGSGHQLKNNESGGTGAYPGGQDNGDCEFDLAAGNLDAGGNKANGVLGLTIPGCTGTP